MDLMFPRRQKIFVHDQNVCSTEQYIHDHYGEFFIYVEWINENSNIKSLFSTYNKIILKYSLSGIKNELNLLNNSSIYKISISYLA